jgi:hypothetical protein
MFVAGNIKEHWQILGPFMKCYLFRQKMLSSSAESNKQMPQFRQEATETDERTSLIKNRSASPSREDIGLRKWYVTGRRGRV